MASTNKPVVQVDIVRFPETRVAVIRHRGLAAEEHTTVRRLVAWKLEQGLTNPERHRHYGLHYFDEAVAADSRVDFCLSLDDSETAVAENDVGIREGIIPASRCARARDIGSRNNNSAAAFLFEHWLPMTREQAANRPVIFHYVNVGPGVRPADMITDVYLPLNK